MRRRTTAGLAVLAVVVTGAGVLGTPSPAAAAPLTFTVTREGDRVNLYRFAVTRTAVTGTGETRADFDGDGRDDVAATASADGQLSFPDTSVVAVRYSSAPFDDLVASGPDLASNCWGRTLAAGDFDADGFDDLVVGAPCEPVGATNVNEAGGVWVIPGSASGLALGRAVHMDQDSPGVPGGGEDGDAFGFAVATGDLTGDGRDDLAVSAPFEDLGRVVDAGTVTVFAGTASGLTANGSLLLHQDLPSVPGVAERNDLFGGGVAIGRVDRGTNADLVVGARGENTGTGMVTLLRGAPGGVATSGATAVLGQTASAVVSDGTVNTTFNAFGMRVAVGDTTGDGLGEVVVSSGTDVATPTTAILSTGAVVVLAGRATGLSTAGMRVVHEDTPGVPGRRETSDGFASSLDVGDVTGDGRADVLVGTPGKSASAGTVTLLRGAAAGVSGAGAQAWTQSSPGVPGTAEAGDQFGWGVSLLNLDGTGPLDAVVSSPGEVVPTDPTPVTAGSVTTFTGGSAGLTPGTSWTSAVFRTPEFFVQDYAATVVGRQSTT